MAAPAAVTAEVRRHYAELVDVLLRDGCTGQARDVARLAVAQGVWADPLQRPVEHLPGLAGRPVHDPARFWFTTHLEARYPAIRAEVDAVLDHPERAFAVVDEPLLRAGRWDQVVLFESGRRQEAACALFPVTAAAVAEIPEATTLGPGVVTLSLLQPGSHIRPHCGRTNAQLRVHLGLRVPGGASMRVGSELRTWEEGRCLIFDDSFEHEVWHRGDAARLILLIDVLHPDLQPAQRTRVLRRRTGAAQQVAAYLAEHDLDAVETDAGGVVLRPSAGSAAQIRRYMAETGARAVHRVGESLRFDRVAGPGRLDPVEPADDISRAVRAAWAEVLQRAQLDDDADFFALGGDSLHAVRIVARLAEDLDLDLSVRAVLETPTLGAMIRQVRQVAAEGTVRA